MAISESAQKIYDRFSDYCAEYMRGEDIDSLGVTVIVHPVYKLTAIASKGSFPQKDRLGRIVSEFSQETYTDCQLKNIPDISGEGNFIGVAVMKEDRGMSDTAGRFLKAIETFHRPAEELLKTIDESFVIAKLMEYEVLQNGEVWVPDTFTVGTDNTSTKIPGDLISFNKWLAILLSGGSSTASIRKTKRGFIISPKADALENFSKDFISIMKETQGLWLKRPKRAEELKAQLEIAISEEKIEIPEEAEESSKVLGMGKRESEVFFREKRTKEEELNFDPFNTLTVQASKEDRNDFANNRFGMDPFRQMNVNEIFFHSMIIY